LTAGAVSAIYILGGTFLFRQVGHFYSAVYMVEWVGISNSVKVCRNAVYEVKWDIRD